MTSAFVVHAYLYDWPLPSYCHWSDKYLSSSLWRTILSVFSAITYQLSTHWSITPTVLSGLKSLTLQLRSDGHSRNVTLKTITVSLGFRVPAKRRCHPSHPVEIVTKISLVCQDFCQEPWGNVWARRDCAPCTILSFDESNGHWCRRLDSAAIRP